MKGSVNSFEVFRRDLPIIALLFTPFQQRVKIQSNFDSICKTHLTEPSDGKIFDYRRMYELVEQLGRPLTDKEAEKFRIK